MTLLMTWRWPTHLDGVPVADDGPLIDDDALIIAIEAPVPLVVPMLLLLMTMPCLGCFLYGALGCSPWMWYSCIFGDGSTCRVGGVFGGCL